ncbi:MAG: hypothetical protein IT495_20360 [Gammaproteobacteria bacterium]|nr:hypothetical protein [Gammaproteobacteria bacterium]
MRFRRHHIAVLVLIVLLPISSIFLYRAYIDNRHLHLPVVAPQAPRAAATGIRWSREAEPGGARGKKVPESGWASSRVALYRGVVEASPPGTYDVLVVPCQPYPEDPVRVAKWLKTSPDARRALIPTGVDGVGRAVMTLALTERARRDLGLRIPDPLLVGRALNGYSREPGDSEIMRLAQALRVATVMRCYTGREPPDTIAVTAVWTATAGTNGNSPFREQSWQGLKIGDERPPEAAFMDIVDAVVAGFGRGNVATADEAADVPAVALPPLPETLDVAPDAVADDPLTAVYVLQLYGLLAPEQPGDLRDRMFERSLVLTDLRLARSPHYRLLRARALFHLHRRPAAIAVLGAGTTAPERALRALMDGDGDQLAGLSGEIGNPWERVLARIEHLRLLDTVGAEGRESVRAALVKDHAGWAAVLWHALIEADPWGQVSTLALKSELDRVFPLPGYSVEDRLTAAGGNVYALGSETDLAALATSHVNRQIQSTAGEMCCEARPLMPRRSDYLELIDARVLNNLIKIADHQLKTQGRPDAALAMLSRLAGTYGGQPDLTAIEAAAWWHGAKRESGATRQNMLRQAFETAASALHWSGGQTPGGQLAVDVLEGATQDARNDGVRIDDEVEIAVLAAAYSYDFPRRPYWSKEQAWTPSGVEFPRTQIWDYEYASSRPLFVAARNLLVSGVGVEAADALIARNAHRFKSDTERLSLHAWFLTQSKRPELTRALYRRAVDDGAADWYAYLETGKELADAGNYEDAAAVFLKYPGFGPDSGANRVLVSNEAFDAGSYLFWRGAAAQARQLFAIAAKLQTGSAASLASAQRLALLEHDWAAALDLAQRRARRYDDYYAYRDHLGLLFALGRSAEAWAQFDTLAPRIASPEIWLGALTGVQADGLDAKSIQDWILARRSAVGSGGGTRRLMTFALLALTVDRDGEGLAEIVTALEAPELGDLASLAMSYAAVVRKDFASAYDRLGAAYQKYGNTPYVRAELLPYYVRAAMATGHADAAETAVARLDAARSRITEVEIFALELARALLAAGRGDADEALAALHTAFARQTPGTYGTLPQHYQLLECAEWLYQDTGDERIRGWIASRARALQQVAPTWAWNYVFEALYTDDPERRTAALGIALHLDRRSLRLRAFSEQDRARATQWFDRHRPFAVPADSKVRSGTALLWPPDMRPRTVRADQLPVPGAG